MVSLSVGTLIYLGAMPLVKTYLTIGFGYIMARLDLFPASASRGASHITMNLALPCLVFANIVPAFTPSNISALGPLFLLGFVYQFLGFLFGLFIREVCYVPRNFYQGLVVMCATSNWGNLPTAVVLSVTQVAPFNPATDPDLGVSYVSIFIVAYFLGFWVSGAAHSISWDYLPHIPQGEAAEQKVVWKEKPLGKWFYRTILRYDAITFTTNEPLTEKRDAEKNENDNITAISALNSNGELTRRLSNSSKVASPETTIQDTAADTAAVIPATSVELPPEGLPVPWYKPALHRLRQVLSVLATPVTVVLAISIPIALVQPLKSLFVDTTAQGGPNWKGPDGRPPLFFIIDTATFVGNLTVPMGLILLGASFARLKLPRPLSRLPWIAMISVTIAKMVIMPVFGIFVVQAMVKNGLISPQSKVERFVTIFLAGTPAAVNQMIATQLYSPDGTVDTLSAFILIQYVFMFIGSSALAAIAIALL